MKVFKRITLWATLLFLAYFPLRTARADTFNKLTYMTFSAPFEIPGSKGPVVLPAGTYTFRLLDSLGDRNIVQIFNKDQTHLYATILAIPDYRLKPTDKTVVTFEERAPGSPQALKAWFYPGDLFGQEFVYPKARAVELAKATHEPVPAMPDEEASNIAKPAKTAKEPSVMALEKAPLKAEQPSGEEVEVAEAFEVAPSPSDAGQTRQPRQTASARRLPKTASMLPRLGLAGVFLTVAGTLLWFVARRSALQ